ncbi:PilZ domain-containing protein [Domibacillus sp. A3M-37]|uniref:PilZ domain-containing protein n=1 Tax=Domibacillus TaxID=1433999 RepID=UPI0020B6CE28|nr:PilZ domain-containing protein [Domibacillus sp. A3M-37]MCP3761826.1 PilZ domain-containing protein [Domibacillus sp. A3M-37]
MYYKRQEAFRYVFPESIPAICEVYQYSAGVKEKTQTFDAYILDISPNGIKAASKTDIELKSDLILIFSFQLAGTLIHFTGQIIRKRNAGSVFEYGIQSDGSDALKDQIISSLKIYTKEQLKKQKG